MRIRTPYNVTDEDLLIGAEEPKGESMTVPDQSMTVREMIERMVAGMPVMGSIHGPDEGYDDDPDLDHPIAVIQDLTDIDELRAIGIAATQRLAELEADASSAAAAHSEAHEGGQARSEAQEQRD